MPASAAHSCPAYTTNAISVPKTHEEHAAGDTDSERHNLLRTLGRTAIADLSSGIPDTRTIGYEGFNCVEKGRRPFQG
jgi:hypothetical protein